MIKYFVIEISKTQFVIEQINPVDIRRPHSHEIMFTRCTRAKGIYWTNVWKPNERYIWRTTEYRRKTR